MKKIKVEQLTKEAFAEFGEVLSYEGREDCGAKGSHTWYPQVVVRDTPTSINLMEVFRKPFTVKKFEAHDHTEENLFAMTGGIIVPFAPAGKPDPDKVRAFYIPKGMGISCKPGVWHWLRIHWTIPYIAWLFLRITQAMKTYTSMNFLRRLDSNFNKTEENKMRKNRLCIRC